MKKNVLLIEPTIRSIGVEILKEYFNVFVAPDGSETTLIKYMNENKISAVITRVESISNNVIENCPSLEIIGQHGVGVDNIDVSSATKNGVIVINVPNANGMSVAEHTIMFILSLSRRLIKLDTKVRAGEWACRETNIPMEINAKVLFILGLGKIGQEVARKAKAFNMKLIGYDPFVSKEDMELFGVEKVKDLPTGLKQADFITIHIPLTKDTRHLISKDEINYMKQTACIMNLGRGPVVDETALYNALAENRISGAALDVLEKEPPDDNNPLLQLDNVILTPHVGGDTVEAKDRCSKTLALEVKKVLEGVLPAGIVNPKVLGIARIFKK